MDKNVEEEEFFYELEDLDTDVLITKHDAEGKYYVFNNKKGKEIKYYLESPSAKVNFKLKNIDDFPTWSKELLSFIVRWEFDNILRLEKEETINNTENAILKEVIKDSISDDIKFFNEYDTNSIKIYNRIKDRYVSKYPRSLKDRMWKKIVVDNWCSNTNKFERTISNMIAMEVWSHKPTDGFVMNNRYFIAKISGSITTDLEKLVSRYMGYNNFTFDYNMKPQRYLEYICNSILEHKHELGIYEESSKFCEHCNSEFHHPKNCPEKFKTLRPTST